MNNGRWNSRRSAAAARQPRQRLAHASLGTGALVLLTASIALADVGLVASVVRAPIVPDGDVVGRPTEALVNLAIDPDPSVPGLTLRQGERLHITLPDDFVFDSPDDYPISDFLDEGCGPGDLRCSTVILLHGWPQHPLLPVDPADGTPQYSLSYDKQSNTLKVLVERTLEDVALPGPGVKQIHLALLGFRNPAQAGAYPVRVSVVDIAGDTRAAGRGTFTVREAVAPSLNATSIYDDNGAAPPNLNTLFQRTQPGQPTPLPWDFLVWDADGGAFEGLRIGRDEHGDTALVHAGRTVGSVTIDTPAAAVGHTLSGGPTVRLPREPVFGTPIPTGRLTARFVAGSKPGRYRVTFSLHGGNSVTHVVDVGSD